MIEQQALARPHIRTLHILHDGSWLQHPLANVQVLQLSNLLLQQSKDWPGGPMRRITHSGKMLPWSLTWPGSDPHHHQVWQGMVDVELARRADLFFGNGYSSLSSQVVALRLGADNGRAEDVVLL